EIITEEHPDTQRAVLNYRTISSTSQGSLLEIELQTGRMHQIRIQCASRGHPILGDILYGSRFPFGPQCEDHRLRSIALHARQLSIIRLGCDEPETFIASPPVAWREI